jgi:thioester reductase-like protein
MRQKEYQNMLEKTPPTEIDFRENIQQDQAIGNMDELLQKHMNDRKQEMEQYNASNVIQTPVNPVLKIDNSSNIHIEVEPISLQMKKSVSWKDENNDFENKEEFYARFDASLNEFHDIFKRITVFQNDFYEKLSIAEQSNHIATIKMSSITTEQEDFKSQLKQSNITIENLESIISENNNKNIEIENIIKNIQKNLLPAKIVEEKNLTKQE